MNDLLQLELPAFIGNELYEKNYNSGNRRNGTNYRQY